MLDGYDQRAAYTALFGAMTYTLVYFLLGSDSQIAVFAIGSGVSEDPLYSEYAILKLLWLLAMVILTTFRFYPIFACLSTEYKFAGAIMGFILSGLMLSEQMWLCSCLNMSGGAKLVIKKYLHVLLLWPNVLCMVIVCCQFVRNIIQCVRDGRFGSHIKQESPALDHHLEHVHLLLRKEPPPWSEVGLKNLSIFSKKKLLANWGFRRVPGFKFPTRVLATLVMTMLALYQIAFKIVFFIYTGLDNLYTPVILCAEFFPPFICDWIGQYYSIFIGYIDLAVLIWIIVMIVNVVLAFLYVYKASLHYRQHALRIYKGDRTLFPKSWSRETSASLLAAASKQAGLQIAYSVWGFVIIQVFTFLCVAAATFVLIIPATDFKYFGLLRWLGNTLISPLALTLFLMILQSLLARFCFLQSKVNASDANNPLALDNRKAWFNVSFFFFFWNLFLGVISALMRILKGLILGIYFIPVVHRPVLMRGFEKMDNGFYAYLCLLSVLNAHDHPVLKSFIHILMNSVKEKRNAMMALEQSQDVKVEMDHPEKMKTTGARNTYSGSKRARYYWFLAYTLIHNPDLLVYRKVEDTSDSSIDNGAETKRRKHKIVLAIHRKNQGETTDNLYTEAGDNLKHNEIPLTRVCS